MPTRVAPARAALFAVALLVLGFMVGYGFHTAQPPSGPGLAKVQATVPPQVKGLRVSPDGSRIAFSAVSDKPPLATRFVLNFRSGEWLATDTPAGWQDYTMQWSADGRRILFDREKIPRDVEDTTGGLYSETLQSGAAPKSTEAKPVLARGALPAGQTSISGLWTRSGELVVKTRSEPKALYQVGPKARLLDRASATFLQNRAVVEGGKNVFYNVRDAGSGAGSYALFRVADKAADRLTPVLTDVEWSYLSEDAHWMVICRSGSHGAMRWTLYRVSPSGAKMVTEQAVPGDIISVFWSHDNGHILGGGGKFLWKIDIPTLRASHLGIKGDWEADDAAWLPGGHAVIIAARGALWRVEIPSGAAKRLWQIPNSYWH